MGQKILINVGSVESSLRCTVMNVTAANTAAIVMKTTMLYKQDIADKDQQEHGIHAFYAGGPGEPYYQPVLDCTCGFSSGRCDSWKEAGSLIDSHLESC